MENHLEYLTIENFKSIKQAHFECSKVNVFIGKPNTGKSNLLEAISLLSNFEYGLSHIRVNNTTNLFYDNDTNLEVKVECNTHRTTVKYDDNIDQFSILFNKNINNVFQMFGGSHGFKLPGVHQMPLVDKIFSSIRNYHFNGLKTIHQSGKNYLTPPYGENLVRILNQRKEFHSLISRYIEDFGYKFKINFNDKEIFLQKEGLENVVYEIPFELTAETFRRIIFHLLAIKTNENAVVCLEEPEAHIYAPYIRDIVEAIADDETNQFFIATHSSSFLVDLLERVPENLRLFVVYFENFETKIKQISNEEINKYLSNGSDFFYRLDDLVEA